MNNLYCLEVQFLKQNIFDYLEAWSEN
jgi:hypothetical protein